MNNDRAEKANELSARIAKERGFQRPWREMLTERDPCFMELYHKAAMHVLHERKALPVKFKEILILCLDSMTHYEEGFRIHTRRALEHGATEDEILEALEVCSLLGIHNLSVFLPALVDEVGKLNVKTDVA